MKLQATFYVLAAIFAAVLAASITDLKTDIGDMNDKTQALRDDISNVSDSGATAMNLIAIQSDVDDLDNTINHSTSDVDSVQPNPISESDAQDLMDLFNQLNSVVVGTLTDLTNKRAAFTQLDSGFIVQDLEKLQSSTDKLADSFKNVVPADIDPEITSDMNQVDPAFKQAIAAYSS